MRSGGLILFIGAVLFIVTIGFEKQAGWPPPDGTDVAALVHQLWPSLRWIWTVQMVAGFLLGMSALLILRSPHLENRWIATTVIWSAIAIGSIIVVLAFGLALGSYPPALLALEANPDIFSTLRGGIRFLFMFGLGVVVLGYHVLFIGEAVMKSGIVPRYWLIAAVVTIVLAIMAGSVGLPTDGVVAFLTPAMLGLALWKAGREFTPDAALQET